MGGFGLGGFPPARPPAVPAPSRVPIVGMQPGVFICSGCGRRVEEAYHGSGFEKCGSLRHESEEMLCPRCLSILKEVLDALHTGREALAAYLREVEASPWP